MTQPLTLDGLLALCEKATPPFAWYSSGYLSGYTNNEHAAYIAALSPEVVAALVRAVQAGDVFRTRFMSENWREYAAELDGARAALDAAMRGKP